MSLTLVNAKQLWMAVTLVRGYKGVGVRASLCRLVCVLACLLAHVCVHCVNRKIILFTHLGVRGWPLPTQLNAMQMLLLPSSCQSHRRWHSGLAAGAFTLPVIFTKWEITLACLRRPVRKTNALHKFPLENCCEVRTTYLSRRNDKENKQRWSCVGGCRGAGVQGQCGMCLTPLVQPHYDDVICRNGSSSSPH